MQPKKNCCMTFWGVWKNSLIFLNNLSVDLSDTCTTVVLPYSQLCRLLASRHRHGDTSTAYSCAQCAHYLHLWHGAWCIANGASLYLRDSHRVLKLKLCHLDSASEWPKLIMPLAGGQTPERLWPLAILIFRPTHVQKTYTMCAILTIMD